MSDRLSDSNPTQLVHELRTRVSQLEGEWGEQAQQLMAAQRQLFDERKQHSAESKYWQNLEQALAELQADPRLQLDWSALMAASEIMREWANTITGPGRSLWTQRANHFAEIAQQLKERARG